MRSRDWRRAGNCNWGVRGGAGGKLQQEGGGGVTQTGRHCGEEVADGVARVEDKHDGGSSRERICALAGNRNRAGQKDREMVPGYAGEVARAGGPVKRVEARRKVQKKFSCIGWDEAVPRCRLGAGRVNDAGRYWGEGGGRKKGVQSLHRDGERLWDPKTGDWTRRRRRLGKTGGREVLGEGGGGFQLSKPDKGGFMAYGERRSGAGEAGEPAAERRGGRQDWKSQESASCGGGPGGGIGHVRQYARVRQHVWAPSMSGRLGSIHPMISDARRDKHYSRVGRDQGLSCGLLYPIEEEWDLIAGVTRTWQKELRHKVAIRGPGREVGARGEKSEPHAGGVAWRSAGWGEEAQRKTLGEAAVSAKINDGWQGTITAAVQADRTSAAAEGLKEIAIKHKRNVEGNTGGGKWVESSPTDKSMISKDMVTYRGQQYLDKGGSVAWDLEVEGEREKIPVQMSETQCGRGRLSVAASSAVVVVARERLPVVCIKRSIGKFNVQTDYDSGLAVESGRNEVAEVIIAGVKNCTWGTKNVMLDAEEEEDIERGGKKLNETKLKDDFEEPTSLALRKCNHVMRLLKDQEEWEIFKMRFLESSGSANTRDRTGWYHDSLVVKEDILYQEN
ncbi:hypothetical protein Tco_0545967 [Tanacetum coccineum]